MDIKTIIKTLLQQPLDEEAFVALVPTLKDGDLISRAVDLCFLQSLMESTNREETIRIPLRKLGDLLRATYFRAISDVATPFNTVRIYMADELKKAGVSKEGG